MIIVLVLCAGHVSAQRKDFHDTLRYNQMNEQGVWSVGVGIAPVAGMTHTVGGALGGQRLTSTGLMGFSLEGGYFVVDNLKLKLTLSTMDDSWMTMLAAGWNSYTTMSQYRVALGAHFHFGRFDLGAGFFVGGSTLEYVAADVEHGGTNDTPFVGDSFRDRRAIGGLSYELGVMISPFFKVSGFVEPSLTFKGSDYCGCGGVRLIIFLPFINSVVCK